MGTKVPKSDLVTIIEVLQAGLYSRAEIAKMYDIHLAHLSNLLVKAGYRTHINSRVTMGEINWIRKARTSGHTLPEIAALLGIKIERVRYISAKYINSEYNRRAK